MKKRKRKIKRSVYVLFIVLILIAIVILFLPHIINKDNNTKSEPTIKEENPQPIQNEKRMSLLAVGDILIHESVYKDAYDGNTYNFHKMFTEVEPIINKYDLKFCNQESTIGGTALGISGYPSFNSPEEIGDELVNLGFNLISLANNHALDKGVDAIKYSNSYWKTKNVIYEGTYSSETERNNIEIHEKNGIKYAFLAYTTLSNRKPPNDYILNIYSASRAKNDIESIKDKVDVIIVSMHWGVEDSNTVSESQKQIAEYLSSLGVNIIIGHHPHVVQKIEYIGDTLVIYSLGNFISNQLSIGLNNGIGLMVGVDIVLKDNKVSFENLYEELTLAYAKNSTNFKVIPFSKLNDNLLSNYKAIEKQYMKIVTGDEE